MFFDPKTSYEEKTINRVCLENGIQTLGPFSYPASVQYRLSPSNPDSLVLHSPEDFLNRYRSRLLLLNGVDLQTNAHPVGEQMTWSGHGASEYPSIAALLAIKASRNFDLPCAYLANNGGYVKTLGLVPLTQVNDAQRIREIANQERFPVAGATVDLFSEQTSRHIRQANEKRIQHLNQQLSLPESKNALGHYQKALLAKNGLGPLMDHLPTPTITLNALRPGAGSALNSALQQAEMALYGFNSGTMASASLSLGSFDSHSNNDNEQLLRLGYLFVLLEYVLETAETLGLRDKLTVVVGSDFSRTPLYNSENGKDHWNTSSYMLFGPGISGNRVLGATAANQHPEHVNPTSPAQRLHKDAGGIVLKPSHVHHALRRVLGLAEFNSNFGLLDRDIQLF